ncbi:MAG: hypothetical protein MUE69_00225 [Myxococcota bacterium]|jgi:hypothetical protein|nr:hypothetical protein [Myxococcota bacterium]
MLRARVLWVLASIADAVDRTAARRATYAALDPLVRGLVRGRVERAVARAQLDDPSGGDEAHVHRLAFLGVLGVDDGAHHGPDEVRVRYETARASLREPTRFGPTKVLVVVTTLATLAIGALVYVLTLPPTALRATAEERADAWQVGGRPLAGSPEVRALFEDALPSWVVALDRLRVAREQRLELGASTPEVANLDAQTTTLIARSRAALGDDFTSFLHAVLDQARALVEDDAAPAADSHLRSIDALDAAIAERGLGYYVDAEVLSRTTDGPGRNRVYLSTFTVERVAHHRSGDERVRVLRLRRLDRLAIARNVLGFTREQVRDALVLEERIETHLVDFVLPSLADDAGMPLFDDGPGAEGEWVRELERAAGEDARALASSVSPDALALGALLARRKSLLDGFQERFPDLVITRPRGFDFDPESYAAIADRVPRAQWRELESIASELREDAPRRAYGALEDVFARSIERHEAQHRLDYAAGVMSRALPTLHERLGNPFPGRRSESPPPPGEAQPSLPQDAFPPEHVRDDRAWARIAETSAYLSELARAPEVAKVNLALFGRHLFLRRAWGTVESSSILVIYEGLARRLAIETPPLLVRRRVDREALARLHLALRARPNDELASAAKDLWAELFGGPLPELVREPDPAPAG